MQPALLVPQDQLGQQAPLALQELARSLEVGSFPKMAGKPQHEHYQKPLTSVLCARCGSPFALETSIYVNRVKASILRGKNQGEPRLYCSTRCSAAGTLNTTKQSWTLERRAAQAERVRKLRAEKFWSTRRTPKPQRFECKCGVTFYLLPKTAIRKMRELSEFGMSELYCSRSCAFHYSPFGAWPTFVQSYEEMEEQVFWEERLVAEGLSMERGRGFFGQYPLYKDGSAMWESDPNKQRQFSYGV